MILQSQIRVKVEDQGLTTRHTRGFTKVTIPAFPICEDLWVDLSIGVRGNLTLKELNVVF